VTTVIISIIRHQQTAACFTKSSIGAAELTNLLESVNTNVAYSTIKHMAYLNIHCMLLPAQCSMYIGNITETPKEFDSIFDMIT